MALVCLTAFEKAESGPCRLRMGGGRFEEFSIIFFNYIF